MGLDINDFRKEKGKAKRIKKHNSERGEGGREREREG